MFKRERLPPVLCSAALAAIMLVAAAPAMASVYFHFDYGTLQFDYVRNANLTPNAGEVIGTLTMSHITGISGSSLTAQKWDYGPNGLLDGPGVGDDCLLGSTALSHAFGFPFLLAFDSEVIYYGSNNYRVVTTASGLTGTDVTTASDSFAAEFGSTGLSFDGDRFDMTGDLGFLAGNDAILLNTGEPGDAWTFVGGVGSIGLSGTSGDNRRNYDRGWLFELHVDFGDDPAGLDSFFGLGSLAGFDRTSSGADMKVTIIPVPGAALLGAVGLGVVSRMRRWLS